MLKFPDGIPTRKIERGEKAKNRGVLPDPEKKGKGFRCKKKKKKNHPSHWGERNTKKKNMEKKNLTINMGGFAHQH